MLVSSQTLINTSLMFSFFSLIVYMRLLCITYDLLQLHEVDISEKALHCVQVLLKLRTSRCTWKMNYRSCRAVKIWSDNFRKLSETPARLTFLNIYC